MAGITLAQAEAKLSTWLAAEEKCAAKQSYTISSSGGSRTLTFADLSDIREQIDYWQGHVTRLSRASTGRRGPRYAVGE